MFHFRKKTTYLDYASATPLDRTMWRRYQPLPATVLAANPGALHQDGVRAKRALEAARASVACDVGAHADEIIFTSGATESNTLALIGAAEQLAAAGMQYEDLHIITTALEHKTVSVAAQLLLARGAHVSVLQLDERGIIDPKKLRTLFTQKTTIVSCVYVSSDIGTIQPIREIAKEIREWKKTHPDQTILFHVDATQAVTSCLLNVEQLHVDLMTLGSTKLYCPRGVGVLFKRRGVGLKPVHAGGSQEFGLRPGTEPLDIIHRFAYALHYARSIQKQESERLTVLQTYFETELCGLLPTLRISGEGAPRVPFITHAVIPEIDSELLVLELDARGILVSSKSACMNDEPGASGIVEQLYGTATLGAVRFSFGRQTKKAELVRAIEAFGAVLKKYGKI
ncbi:MAG TPA: cysteine desulfurase family protein [Candidatus Paceibacterota bacterium]|nr:cysteine desulfurase family protein [Candidatus Paceibacterota bacterium]